MDILKVRRNFLLVLIHTPQQSSFLIRNFCFAKECELLFLVGR